MKRTQFLLIMLILGTALLAAACGTEAQSQAAPTPGETEPVALENLALVQGQVVFVPAYSEVFYFDRARTVNLAITLAIHNTDLARPIIIKSVRYYDTNGSLVEEFIAEPERLGPMATRGIVLEQGDDRGGVGANFIVEWAAETDVYEPVIEAVMVSTTGSQGISLLSTGRVISQTVASD